MQLNSLPATCPSAQGSAVFLPAGCAGSLPSPQDLQAAASASGAIATSVAAAVPHAEHSSKKRKSLECKDEQQPGTASKLRLKETLTGSSVSNRPPPAIKPSKSIIMFPSSSAFPMSPMPFGPAMPTGMIPSGPPLPAGMTWGVPAPPPALLLSMMSAMGGGFPGPMGYPFPMGPMPTSPTPGAATALPPGSPAFLAQHMPFNPMLAAMPGACMQPGVIPTRLASHTLATGGDLPPTQLATSATPAALQLPTSAAKNPASSPQTMPTSQPEPTTAPVPTAVSLVRPAALAVMVQPTVEAANAVALSPEPSSGTPMHLGTVDTACSVKDFTVDSVSQDKPSSPTADSGDSAFTDCLSDLPLPGNMDDVSLIPMDWLFDDDGDASRPLDLSCLGLSLKKTGSFVDLINESLCFNTACSAS